MHIPDDELAAMPTGRNYTCDMTPFSPDCLPYMVQNNRSMHTWLFDVSHALLPAAGCLRLCGLLTIVAVSTVRSELCRRDADQGQGPARRDTAARPPRGAALPMRRRPPAAMPCCPAHPRRFVRGRLALLPERCRQRPEGKSSRYRCHLGCIPLRMAAISLVTGARPGAGRQSGQPDDAFHHERRRGGDVYPLLLVLRHTIRLALRPSREPPFAIIKSLHYAADHVQTACII